MFSDRVNTLEAEGAYAVTRVPLPTPPAFTQAAQWNRPAATAAPQAATTATLGLSVVTGPASLLLWTGDTIAVKPAGSRSDNGLVRWEVERDLAGWHTNTDDCGAGLTIIGGHVSYDGVPGIFFDLATIKPGDTVVCTDAHANPHRFAPVDYILADGKGDPATWTPDWTPALLLYTCTPELNGQVIVVRFEEVDNDGLEYSSTRP